MRPRPRTIPVRVHYKANKNARFASSATVEIPVNTPLEQIRNQAIDRAKEITQRPLMWVLDVTLEER